MRIRGLKVWYGVMLRRSSSSLQSVCVLEVEVCGGGSLKKILRLLSIGMGTCIRDRLSLMP